MKPIHKRRLRKLIAFLRQLPRKRFDFTEVRIAENCGTIGCAIGWTPEVLPDLVQLDAGGEPRLLKPSKSRFSGFMGISEEITGLPPDIASDLFTPDCQSGVDSRLSDLPGSATPKQVAAMLEKFIALQEAK